MGWIILGIAGLNFLGLGSQPPTPEWGAMLNDSRSYLQTAPQLLLYPGVAIFLLVLGFNLLGDGLRDLLDPTAYRRFMTRQLDGWDICLVATVPIAANGCWRP